MTRRKVLLLILFLLMGVHLPAQENVYFQNDPAWLQHAQCNFNFGLPICLETITTQYALNGDTLINGLSYYIMSRLQSFQEMGFDNPPFPNWCSQSSFSMDQLALLVRSEGKKVFMRYPNDDAEILFYDFGLEVGDTIPQMDIQEGIITVSGIDSMLIAGSYYKTFALNDQYDFPIYEYLIEGIGASTGLFTPLNEFSVCNYFDIDCYSLNGTTIYPEVAIGACQIILATEEFSKEHLEIAPNPNHGIFSISGFHGDLYNVDLLVFDISGRLVHRDRAYQAGAILDISAFGPGLYFLNGTGSGENFRGKVVVQ